MTPAAAVRVPRFLVRFGYSRPRLVLALAIGTVAAGIWLGTHLGFETDILNLLPRNDPAVVEFRRVLGEFGSLDTLLLAVPITSEEKVEQAQALVDALIGEIEASPYVAHVEARLDDPVKLADTVLRRAVLFLDADGLAALRERLGDAGLEARARDIRSSLDAPHGMVAKELAIRDPLGFLPLLLGRLNRAPASLKLDYSSGYLMAADHSMVLLLVKPKGPAQDIAFDRLLLPDINARIAAVRAAQAADGEVALAEIPEVIVGGGHRIAHEDASLIRSDIVFNSVTSIVGVMLLFFLVYRRFATAQYAFLPLAVGLALTFIFVYLAIGRLNSATSGFSAMLVGMGIDFTIVMYGRYLEERHAGRTLEASWDEVATHSGPAVITGAVTTAGTFLAFLATRFAGLRELGMLTGVGILLMLVSSFVVLPALVALFDRGKLPPQPPRALHLAPVISYCRQHRRLILWGAVALTLAAGLLVPRQRFDDDVRNLRSPANQGVAVQERIAKAFGLSFNAMMIRIEGKDEREVMDRLEVLAPRLDVLVASGTISSFESLAHLVPPRAAQEMSLAWLEANRELADPARIRRVLGAALKQEGLVLDAFAEGMTSLDAAFRPAGPVTLEMWRGTPVDRVVERSLRSSPGRVATVVNVFSPPGKWRREAPPELVKLVAGTPGATLTGVNLMSRALRRIVWQDAVIAGGLGLLLVIILLYLDFRRLSWALLCLLPVAGSLVLTIALMTLLGMPMNSLNVFVITMVIGIGSDYAVHMLHRRRETGAAEGLGQTGRAVLLSALTTVVGFGSLATTSYPGLKSIGWMASFGVLFACAISVTVVPLLIPSRSDAVEPDEDLHGRP